MNPIARLPFAEPERPEIYGELQLHSDQTLRLISSPALRAEVIGFMNRVDHVAARWGASLTIGGGAVGATFRWHNRNGIALFLFGIAFLCGVVGAVLRFVARDVARAYFTPQPLHRVDLKREENGDLKITVNGRGMGKFSTILRADSLPSDDVRAFVEAVERARR